MSLHLRLIASIPLAIVSLTAGAAVAADVVIINHGPTAGLSAAAIANAKPIVNPLAPPNTANIKADAGAVGLVPGSSAGSSAGALSAKAFGSFGIPYTSTRVQLRGSIYTSTSIGAAYLGTTFPYSPIGKLFINGGRYCSASVIRMGIIVTAAHCIQNFGSGSSTFGGWTFYPARYSPSGSTATQQAPFGAWPWRALVRPVTWSNGTDVGCGAARDNDLAVIALAKVGGKFIGQQTGRLGYGWNNYSFVSSSKTGNLKVAAISTLGYPALMDGGNIMQRADGPSYLTTICNAGQIWQGNNFTGGSSGGPWIVNFVSYNPALSGGAVPGTAPTTAVVGVTSWGSADPNKIKDNYASQFRQNSRYPAASYGSPSLGAGNIASLLATLCAAVVGGSTFQAQGYCN